MDCLSIQFDSLLFFPSFYLFNIHIHIRRTFFYFSLIRSFINSMSKVHYPSIQPLFLRFHSMRILYLDRGEVFVQRDFDEEGSLGFWGGKERGEEEGEEEGGGEKMNPDGLDN